MLSLQKEEPFLQHVLEPSTFPEWPITECMLCKFYVVDSQFNPIIVVGNCLKLGLITFQSPVYTGWNDGKPVSIGVHAVDQGTRRTMKTVMWKIVTPMLNQWLSIPQCNKT